MMIIRSMDKLSAADGQQLDDLENDSLTERKRATGGSRKPLQPECLSLLCCFCEDLCTTEAVSKGIQQTMIICLH